MLLQNLIPLLPSEVIMPLAGFLASLGYMDLRGAILAGLAGSLAGHLPWYLLGRGAGEERLLRWGSRYGRWFGLRESHIARADAWFHRNTARAVFLGRLVPGIRTCVNVPAGASRMPFLPFLGYTVLGEAAWTTSLAWGGYTLGKEYHLVSWYLHVLILPAALGGALWAIWLIRSRSRRNSGHGSHSGHGGAGKAWPAQGRRPLRLPPFRRLPWRLRFPGIPKGA